MNDGERMMDVSTSIPELVFDYAIARGWCDFDDDPKTVARVVGEKIKSGELKSILNRFAFVARDSRQPRDDHLLIFGTEYRAKQIAHGFEESDIRRFFDFAAKRRESFSRKIALRLIDCIAYDRLPFGRIPGASARVSCGYFFSHTPTPREL